MNKHNLYNKKQLNVQEQNELTKKEIMDVAHAFKTDEIHTNWVVDVLEKNNINPIKGILVEVTSIPCGGNEQSSYAKWLSNEGMFYEIEATTNLSNYKLITIDDFEKTNEKEIISSHLPGKGKSFGQLSLEVLHELHKKS